MSKNPENELLRKRVLEFRQGILADVRKLRWYHFGPCRLRILMVTDGSLGWGDDDFGMSTLLNVLATPPGPYVRFEITVAHRNAAPPAQLESGSPAVVRKIPSFRFDNADHFGVDKYDQLWLFGISTGPDLNPTELGLVARFMNAGKGVFATGDHGQLGAALCGQIPRVRSMRRWYAAVAPGMSDPDRNDTNRPGDSGTFTFDDQSDDIPQSIYAKRYTRRVFLTRASWPHPLLCGPKGMIEVLPDHPHEGECVTPTPAEAETTLNGVDDYPKNSTGFRVLPEVIATSTVLPNNNAGGGKSLTNAQAFGAISAYDGHQVGIGRVVTDATWHHFVNINLRGRASLGPGDPEPDKTLGFLSSPEGEEAFEKIKAYYRNIAVWIAPTERIRCMRKTIIWDVIYSDRVMEAVTTGLFAPIEKSDIRLLWEIGLFAKDVLGRSAGRCQAETMIIDWLRPHVQPELLDILDPWPPKLGGKRPPRPSEPDPIPWFNPEPLLEIALGGAIMAVREAFPEPNETALKDVQENLEKVMEQGIGRALAHATDSLNISGRRLSGVLKDLRERGKR